MRRFNDNVHFFQVDGIQMIGNFNNGSIIGISDDAYNYLLYGIKYDDECELENALNDLGFYDEDESMELFGAYLHVTDKCNLDCIGCYSFVEDRNCLSELKTDDIYMVLDQLSGLGLRNLVISGGEPFLREDLCSILRYAKEKCKIQNIATITNGTLNINQYENSLPYIDSFNISIDGFSVETSFLRPKYVFEKIEKLIRELPTGTNINLISTLHKKNAPFMKEYKGVAERYGTTYSFSIFTVEETDPLFLDYVLNDEDLRRINQILQSIDKEAFIKDTPIGNYNLNCRYKCEAGDKMISIDARGNVYPCHMLHREELKMGSVLNNDIRDIIKSEDNYFRTLKVDDFNDCKICAYKYLCGGGCRGRSYLKTKSFVNKDSYCALNKNFYRDFITEIKRSC